jgi:hypothetical protein
MPSSDQRPNHLCATDREPHCSPLGTSHHLDPVMRTRKIVLQTGLQGVCGCPLPLYSGSFGNSGVIINHCVSVSPSNLPLVIRRAE